jgi:NitT/TauT family transport system permease protein
MSAALAAVRRVLLVLFLVGVWQVLGAVGAQNANLVPTPVQVSQALAEMAESRELFVDAFASLRRVFIGFLLAGTAGLAFGMLLGWLEQRAAWLEAPFELLRPVPPIAWIPLAILWFGIGETPAYFIVFLGAFFPILASVRDGVRGTEILHINAARCLGAGRLLLFTDVILPSTLPSILTGLRVGFGVGWICVITAELVGAQSGLGYMIQLNRLLLRTDKVIAGMVVIGALGFTLNQLLVLLEKKLVRWRGSASLA